MFDIETETTHSAMIEHFYFKIFYIFISIKCDILIKNVNKIK